MLSNILSLTLLASAVTAASEWKSFDPSKWDPKDVIYKPVAIVGGGASGIHAAISLKDKGVASVVIEANDYLGGNTHTYTDKETGAPIDYGVVVYHTDDIVKQYFARFKIPLQTITTEQLSGNTFFTNFNSGKPYMPQQIPDPSIQATAVAKYAALLSQYPQLAAGLFLPDPVPEFFYKPTIEVAKQYGFEAALPLLAQFNPGLGDPFTLPFVENTRVAGLELLATLKAGFLQTVGRNNSLLYSLAGAELAPDNGVLLSSKVVNSIRTDKGVTLVVKTCAGYKLIVASKLLLTIPHKLDYLRPFDLSKKEISIFGKFLNAGYYTSIVRGSALPGNLTAYNVDENAPLLIPQLPAIVAGPRTANPDLHVVSWQTPRTDKSRPYTHKEVKQGITAALKKVNPLADPRFVRFSSHTPFYLQVSAADIKAGFYKDLYSLQGERSTYHAGASFKGQDSTSVWKCNRDIVIPQILASLQQK